MPSEPLPRPTDLELEPEQLPMRIVLSVRSRRGREPERRSYLLRHTRSGRLVLNRDESIDRHRSR
jgi:hypothetical protein